MNFIIFPSYCKTIYTVTVNCICLSIFIAQHATCQARYQTYLSLWRLRLKESETHKSLSQWETVDLVLSSNLIFFISNWQELCWLLRKNQVLSLHRCSLSLMVSTASLKMGLVLLVSISWKSKAICDKYFKYCQNT